MPRAASLFAQLEPVACGHIYGGNVAKCSVDDYLEENPAPCDVAV
ncbi:MAG: hypothetical protein ACLRX5_10205 [Slackia sp.]